MEVKVKPAKPIDEMWTDVVNAARITVGKHIYGKVPSIEFKKRILRAEHTPINLLVFDIFLKGIPTFVSQQFSRHIIAGRHEPIHKTDINHFVRTQRSDRTGIDRSNLSQTEPVEHLIRANAKGLIDMSRKRLCNVASPEAIKAWKLVREKIFEIEPLVPEVMVPDCIYRGHCREIQPCGFDKTNKFLKELERYKNF